MTENLTAFLKRVETDTALRERLAMIDGATPVAEQLVHLASLAAEGGTPVTMEELRSFQAAQSQRELSDEQLERVAGGTEEDLIVGAGTGAGPRVRVFDGITGSVIRDFLAHSSFKGGIRVDV